LNTKTHKCPFTKHSWIDLICEKLFYFRQRNTLWFCSNVHVKTGSSVTRFIISVVSTSLSNRAGRRSYPTHSKKVKKEPNPSHDKAKLNNLPPHNSNYHKIVSCVLSALPQKAINSKLCL